MSATVEQDQIFQYRIGLKDAICAHVASSAPRALLYGQGKINQILESLVRAHNNKYIILCEMK